MSVWVCCPSKRPVERVREWAKAWRERGYKIALWRDEPDIPLVTVADYQHVSDSYPGYAKATNRLITEIAAAPNDARWFVIGGDDVYPDPHHAADEIARECEGHFGMQQGVFAISSLEFSQDPTVELTATGSARPFSTFGVMQPTGDRWGDDERSRDKYGANRGAYIDRVAGSAWIGREFALRSYGGNGPLWAGNERWHAYQHMFPDEELQCVAEMLGIFWQRRDLTQFHNHWARGDNRTRAEHMPEFLAEANSREHWDKYKAIFEARKAAGFPGHEVKA